MPEAELQQRAFIAIPLPAALQQQLAILQRQLRQLIPELKTPQAENLHLTLHFLGTQPQQLLAKIGRDMLSIGQKKKIFNVTLKRLGFFPQRRRPRILWLGIEPQAELVELYQQLAADLEKQGLQPEQRKYRPHLTIGRFRQKVATTEPLCPFLSQQYGSMKIDRMVLYTSELKPQGAIHTPLVTAPFQNND
jgi:2'-5' RNA ligase